MTERLLCYAHSIREAYVDAMSSSALVTQHGQFERAAQDMQDIAQVGTNCYDISELVLHATLRYIAVEENLLNTLYEQQKPTSPVPK